MGKFDGILLGSDLDATLLTNDKRISQRNREAIQRFTAEGGAFTYITGRMPLGARTILDQLTPNVPIGCINGGGIFDPKNDCYVWTAALDDSAEELVSFVQDRFPDVGIELCGFYKAWFLNLTPLTEEHRRLEQIPYVPVSSYAEVNEPMSKVLFVREADRLEELMQAIQAHPLADRFSFVQSTSQYYEMIPKGMSKGDVLLRLADLLGISRSRTVAVGDNNNDLTMLQMAALGVAVANATPQAKAAADLVLDVTNEEDAVAELICRLEKQLPF